jgi:U3 small nucleolar RNA-associated protein 16
LLLKEKRRHLDTHRKSQAKSANKKKKNHIIGLQGSDNRTIHDNLASESATTLQGSIAKETGRLALPAFLPDEILNTIPSVRPPTPPAEDDGRKQRAPKKLKLLNKVEKPAKDLRLGDVTIRVLRGSPGTSTLPPRVSKGEQNIQNAWIAGKRYNSDNGLKRVPSRPTSFVRSH